MSLKHISIYQQENAEHPESGYSEVATVTTNAEPEFPYDAFDGPFSDLAARVALARPVPPELPFMVALSVVGALAGKRVEAYNYMSNRTTRANLCILASAETGGGKSNSVGPFEKVLHDLEAEEAVAWNAKARAWKIEAARLRGAPGTGPRKAPRGFTAANTSDEHAVNSVPDEKDLKRLEEIETFLAQGCPRLLDGAPTVEALQESMASWDECGYLFTDEAEGALQILQGKYKDGGASFGTLCSLITGNPVSGGRIYRKAPALKSPTLSVFFAVQDDLAYKLRGNPEAKDRGLIGRFIWVKCSRDSPIDPYNPVTPISPEVEKAYAESCRALFLRYCSPRSTHNPVKVPLADDAARHLHRRSGKDQSRRHNGEVDAKLYARSVELITRLALCLHLMRHGVEAEGIQIPLTTVQGAEHLYEWTLAPWSESEAESQSDQDEDWMNKVTELLRFSGEAKERDIQRKLRVKKAESMPFLTRMVSSGRLLRSDDPDARTGAFDYCLP
jgi:hypothetical protein